MIPTPRIDAAICERINAAPADLKAKEARVIPKAQKFYEAARSIERELAIALDENAHSFEQRELMMKTINAQNVELDEVENRAAKLREENDRLLDVVRKMVVAFEDDCTPSWMCTTIGRELLEKLGLDQPPLGKLVEHKTEMQRFVKKV